MSEFFKSKKKMGLTMCALMLVVVLAASSVALMWNDGSLFSGGEPEESGIEELETLPEDGGEEEPEPEPEPEPVQYNIPSEMRGVFLVPGQEFLTNLSASESEIKAEIDKAITDAGNFTMNTIIVDTVYEDWVIFSSSVADELPLGFDVMGYIADSARQKGMHVYAIFDASHFVGSSSGSVMLAGGANSITNLTAGLTEFAATYSLDGILIDGYGDVRDGENSYNTYLRVGGGIGYQNYLRQTPSAVVKTAAATVRTASPNTQVGLLAHAVWANADEDEQGSATAATFTSLGSANADTKGFVENGYVDFVAVRAYGSLTDSAEPFEEVVSWWADVARQNGVPMYVVHASDRICTDNSGWSSADQITKQVIQTGSTSGVRGNIFNSLARMVDNPNDATTTLVKYFNEEVEAAHILTELQMTKPEQLVFTTQEPSVTFTGASDPNSPVTINGEEVTTDANGYFTTSITLKAGENVFEIEHKDKTIVYKITRNIDIVKEVSPTGSISTDGNMSITISALAYEDAQVSARVNGTTVPMSIDQSYEVESARDSSYRLFVGTYTAPAGTSSVQNLGAITVTATWQGESKTLTGATISVNKRAQIEDGVPVVVTADQATTYPPDTLTNVPSANYYPLPQGAMDYAVGDELTYVKNGTTYRYTVLASGLRVESGDIQAISSDYASGNSISGMTIHTENGYTYVTIKTSQKVSYNFSYTGSEVKITFNYTTKTPGGSTVLNQNPLFNNASWGSDSLTLSLIKSGGFMGYKGYYDSAGNLVFRFNNTPGSLSSARIAIDPGHGGNDPGALGFLKDYPEKVLNLAIARYLADELESRGATVLLMDTSGNPSLQNRVAQAESFGADIFVSVHNNTAPNASATGTEVYYFYPYSRTLAANASSSVSGSFGTNNRGAKQSYYTVTLSSQFASVLVECGFMTNQGEYEKLLKSGSQQRIAEGIADGIAATISATYTGSSASGSQTVGAGAATTDTQGDTAGTNGSGNGNADNGGTEKITDFIITDDEIELDTSSGNETLDIQTDVNNPDRSSLTWTSSNPSVAKVSASGVVTPVGAGSATITAKAASGATDTVRVRVTASSGNSSGNNSGNSSGGGTNNNSAGIALKDATYVRLEKTDIDLYKNSSYTLVITSEQGTVRNSDFKFETTDRTVATVNENGVVTAKSKAGSCEIIVTASGYEFSCEINVTTTKVAVRSISLNKSSISLVRGSSETLTVNFNPTNSTNQEVTWKSSDTNKASVSSTGVVTAKNTGTVTITATSKDGKFTATCTVYVTARGVDAESVNIYPYALELYVGEEDYLEAEIEPANASDHAVTWTSSNTSVVKVDANGRVTGVGQGTATITATSKSNSRIKDSITVTVYS